MSYKIITLVIFTALMLVVIVMAFAGNVSAQVCAAAGVAISLLVVVQVVAVLQAGEESKEEYADGKYEND